MHKLLLLSAATLLAVGCAPSTRMTFIKPNTTTLTRQHDEQELERTRGVRQAMISADTTNLATLQLDVKETDKKPGITKALELGYTETSSR